ncbi:sigma-70 family RNA polymerase sigma factor [Altererythrobacter soli]|uniref:Sigma-70 family RNA polymerase sigma factor n=2 Tax=Croceibacterium soli TaxID=1739690 RepID=A0A6I4USL9_9SPHN|nr:sigma-70 family RNA polymerase sigma factor [Croceibacterium soli]
MITPSADDLSDLDRRLRPALLSFFMRRVGNRAEAEDLVQEVFVRIARSASTRMKSADAYIFQVAANLLRDRARREKVRADYHDEVRLAGDVDVDPLDPYRITVAREELTVLISGIADLPEKTRRIFTLYRLENIDKRTIADCFSLSVRSVELHIQRALETLAERLGPKP